MQVSYELTPKDFRDAFIASHTWHYRIHACLAGLALTGILIYLLPPSGRTVSEIVAVAFYWAVCVWGPARGFARSQFSKRPSAQGRRTFSWDTSGVHWRWESGAVDNEWKNIVRCLEGTTLFLLFTSAAAFDVVPKRAFDDEHLAEFRSLVATCVPRTR